MISRRGKSFMLTLPRPAVIISSAYDSRHSLSMDGILRKEIRVGDRWHDFPPVEISETDILDIQVCYKNCSNETVSVTIMDECPEYLRIVDWEMPLFDLEYMQGQPNIVDLMTTGITYSHCRPGEILRIHYRVKVISHSLVNLGKIRKIPKYFMKLFAD